MKEKSVSVASRVSWIDICRGIAILFVMYAHMLPSDSYRYLFYAFHMPLFFFLSGIVFKENFKSFWSLIVKSFKAILVPYFLFAALTYFFWFIKEPTTHNTMQDFLTQIYGIFYGNGNNGYLYFNVALWFLPCLFITKIGFALLTKLSSKTNVLVGLLAVFSVIGFALSTYFNAVKLPFGMEIAFSAIVFFGAGFLIKRNGSLFQRLQSKGVVYFILGLVVSIVLATINYNLYGNQIDMRMNRINNYFLFYTAAFSGIFAWIAFSMMIGKSYILEYIGKHTLVLFVWHYLLFSYFTDITTFLLSANVLSTIAFIKPTIYTILAVGIILPGTKLLRELKYSSSFLTKKK
jgi:acyltransferase